MEAIIVVINLRKKVSVAAIITTIEGVRTNITSLWHPIILASCTRSLNVSDQLWLGSVMEILLTQILLVSNATAKC